MNKINECYLEITQNCVLKCKHCYLGDKKSEELDREDWFRIIDKLKKFQIKKCVILGGEPTIHHQFYDILAYAISRFKEVTVETSGATKSWFSDYDCNVAISFESCNPKKNDDIRRFPDSKRSVYELAIKKLINGKKHGNSKIIRMTLYNDTDVLGSIVMAEKLGANLVLMPLIDLGYATELSYRIPNSKKIEEAVETCMMSNDKMRGYHQVQIPQWYMANLDLFNKYSPLFKKQRRICSAGVQRLFVTYSGDIFPCMFLPQFKLGNIMKDNIQSINKKLNEFIKKIKEIKPNGKCKNCSAWGYCGGGCIAQYWNNKSRMGEQCPFTEDLNIKKTLLKGGGI